MIINGFKKCSDCKQRLPIINFWKTKSYSDGLAYRCKSCCYIQRTKFAKANRAKINETTRAWWNKNRDDRNKKQLSTYYKNREAELKYMKTYYARLKDKILTAYGYECKCCGEKNREFLCIDHIHGGGSKDRRKNAGGRGIFVRIIKEGFPKDKYQLLCHNCNMAIGFYGYCPHHPEITRPLSSGRPLSKITQSDTSTSQA